jgi:predicted outer membrane repeat protein
MKKGLKCYLFIACFFGSAIAATAQPIRVKSNATGANNGTSWADAYTSLTSALDAAPAGAEIWVSAGTYLPTPNANLALSTFSMTKDLKLYGGFAGTETMLSQRNPVTNLTTLSGDHLGNDISNDFTTNRTDNAFHVVSVAVLGFTPVIDGFTIKGGNAPTVTTAALISNDNRGGGVFAISPIRLINCTFSDNSASAGGAVSIAGTDASNSIVEKCIFEKNSTNLQGTGLHLEQIDGATVKSCIFRNSAGVRGALHLRTSTAINVDDCSFTGNSSTGLAGGFYSLNASYNLTNSTLTENTSATGGGGMYNEQAAGTNYFINISNCVFTENKITTGANRGGAIANLRAKIQVDKCRFIGNTTAGTGTGSGGALNNTTGTIYSYTDCDFEGSIGNFGGVAVNYNDSNGSYNNCRFRNNTSNAGGGALSYGFKAQGTLNGCLFEDNTANTIGGAVYVQNDTTSVSINQCMFSGNKSISTGGAMFLRAGSSINLSQCDFLGNQGVSGGAVNIQADSILRPLVNVERSTFILNNCETQGAAFNISNSNVVLTNCLVGGNTNLGTTAGGGFSNNASRGLESTLRLVNTTVANNSATIGAGVANWQEDSTSSRAILSTVNSIFENTGNNYEIEEGTPQVISNGGNHSSDASFGASLNGAQDASGVSAQFVDPGLDDYHLRSTSPCINTALPSSAPQYDLEGGFRGPNPDKGAYELGSVGTFTPNPDFDLTVLPNPAAAFVRVQLPKDLTGMANVQVFDLAGKLTLEQAFENHGQAFTLPISNLTIGSYLLRVTINGQQSSKQLVKL